MPQTPGFQTTWRTWFDFAAAFGTVRVNGARILVWHGNIERTATFAVVFDETEKWRTVDDNREAMQDVRRKPLFVAFVEHNCVRAVMTTAPTRDAISAFWIRLSFDWSERHHFLYSGGVCGGIVNWVESPRGVRLTHQR
jgi:hypothetical protein